MHGCGQKAFLWVQVLRKFTIEVEHLIRCAGIPFGSNLRIYLIVAFRNGVSVDHQALTLMQKLLRNRVSVDHQALTLMQKLLWKLMGSSVEN
jgi:hypothetical protein